MVLRKAKIFLRKTRSLNSPQIKVTPMMLRNATTKWSQKNSTFVGYEVGRGIFKKRFSSRIKASIYSDKLFKNPKIKEVQLAPLYFGNFKGR